MNLLFKFPLSAASQSWADWIRQRSYLPSLPALPTINAFPFLSRSPNQASNQLSNLPVSSDLDKLFTALVEAKSMVEKLDAEALDVIKFIRTEGPFTKGSSSSRRTASLTLARSNLVDSCARAHSHVRRAWKLYHQYRPATPTESDPQSKVLAEKEEVMLAQSMQALGEVYQACMLRLTEVLDLTDSVLGDTVRPKVTVSSSVVEQALSASENDPSCDIGVVQSADSVLLDSRASRIANALKQRNRTRSGSMSSQAATAPTSSAAHMDLAATQDQQQQQVLLQRQQQQREALVGVERDVVTMVRLFNDLNDIIQTQGAALDQVENNISITRESVRQGSASLIDAWHYQASTMALAGGALGALVGGPLGASLGAKSALGVTAGVVAGLATGSVAGALTGTAAAKLFEWRTNELLVEHASTDKTEENAALLHKLS
jgi:hypothetical protein